MKNRSKIKISAMILRAANSGASMSRIMYEVYLSSRPLKRYLSFLLERGFLTYDEGVRQYKVTERGLHFLQACEQIEDTITVEGKRTRSLRTPSEARVSPQSNDANLPLEVIAVTTEHPGD